MKVVNLQIECIVLNRLDGIPCPIRIKFDEHVVRKIFTQSTVECKERGKKFFKFICQAVINNVLKIFELRFYLDSCQWILFKI